MGRFDRFTKLERARPDGTDAAAEPQSSGRFEKIEARKEAAVAAPPDPFAPPPEDSEVPIEIAEDDRKARDKIKAEKRAKAQQQIDEERQRVAEMRMRAEAGRDPLEIALAKRGALVNLSTNERIYITLGAVAIIGVLAAIFGRFMWGLAPLVVIVFIASQLSRENR